MLKWLKYEDDMVSTIFQCPDISNSSSWFLDLFDSQSIYVDSKQTLLLSVVIVSAIYAAYYFVTCANNHKLQEKAIYHKDWRIVQYDRDNPICIREHGMYCACVRAVNGNGLCAYAICMECYDKNKPKRKRGSKRRLPVTQIQRSMTSVVKEFLM